MILFGMQINILETEVVLAGKKITVMHIELIFTRYYQIKA